MRVTMASRSAAGHETKLWDEARRLAPDLPEDMARTLLQLREKSLYVDVGPTGDPLTPRGLMDPGELDRGADQAGDGRDAARPACFLANSPRIPPVSSEAGAVSRHNAD
jgi:hypothetical protein